MRIGIDLGGTTYCAGLVDEKLEIVEKTEGKTRPWEGMEAVLGRIENAVAALIKKAGREPVSRIGLGCPGVLDRESGMVVYSNNIGWEQVPAGRRLAERFQVPVYVENDANCAALGEYLAGAGKGSAQMLMVTLGTGIGGGMVLNGKLYRGAHGNGNIFGHLVIEKDGRECTCGRRGCWESYASARALLGMAKKAGIFTKVREEEINGQLFFQALKEGDERARRVFDRYTDYVAEGIADLANILDPELVVIGGGISAQGEILLAPVRSKVKEKVYFRETETAKIVCSSLANDAAIIGAASLQK